MGTIPKNIAANLVGRWWGIVSLYLFIPFYLKFLGVEAYGLVGFYSTLLGVLAFSDLGLTATLSREMARLSVRTDSAEQRSDLLRTYEWMYLGISLILTSAIWLLAPLISECWLRADTLPPRDITVAIRLMGVAIALQLPAQLYSGGLTGLQRQVLANSFQIVWGAIRGFGAVLVLWLLSSTVFAFLAWQVLSNALYCLAVRRSLWLALPRAERQPQFNALLIRDTWRYAGGMAGLAFLSAALTQMDKLLVSKMLSLDVFGYYTLASTLAQAPTILASPIAVAVFPRLTGLVSLGSADAVTRLYHMACKLVAVAALPATLTLTLYADGFLYAWIGSTAAAQSAGTAASLLLGGQILQAVALMPYYLALAHGHVKIVVHLALISVVLLVPLLIVLTRTYGTAGAGLSWLIMNLCTLPPCLYFLHRRFLPGELLNWFWHDVGKPFVVASSCVLLCRWCLPMVSSRAATLGLIGAVWCISVGVSVLAAPELRREAGDRIGRLLGVSYGT